MVELKSRIVFLIYKTILMDFGVQAAKEVFEATPIIIKGKQVSFPEFYNMVFYNKLDAIPFDYVVKVYARVEQYLRNHHKSQQGFMESLLHKRTHAFLVSSGHEILKAIEPYISEAFSERDPRFFVLRMANIIHKVHVPQSKMNVVYEYEVAGTAGAILEIVYSYDEYNRYAYNPDLWKAFIIRESPRGAGAPPFDSVQVRAECRTFDEIIGIGNYHVEDSRVFIDEDYIGDIVKYDDYLSTLGIPAGASYANPNVIGVVTRKEFGVHLGDFPLLRNSCFYGASSCLLQVSFTIIPGANVRILREVIGASSPQHDVPEELFCTRHKELISTFCGCFDIVFHDHTSAEKVVINNRYFNRGIPARLFYLMLRDYLDGRREPYDLRALIEHPLLKNHIDPIKPNLDVRMKRLAESLGKSYPLFSLIHTGQGTYTFGVFSEFTLSRI